MERRFLTFAEHSFLQFRRLIAQSQLLQAKNVSYETSPETIL